MKRHSWTINRRMLVACSMAGIVLSALAIVGTSAAIANQRTVDDLTTSIAPLHTAAADLARSLDLQQRQLNSFVANGMASELDGYRTALADERGAEADIETSSAAPASVREQLRVVVELADRWRAQAADPAIATRLAGQADSALTILDGIGQPAYDQAEAAVAELRDDTAAVRDRTLSSIGVSATRLVATLLTGYLLALVGAVALGFALHRAVVRPLTALAAQVRAAASGDRDVPITGGGVPEVRQVAADVDSLRREIATDLAEVEHARRQIERANVLLEQQAAELSRSNRDLEQFAYVASHDLQEPLRKVSSFCQLLQRRYQHQLDEKANQYLNYAVSGAQRMQRLVNDLLAFSRVGRAATSFTPVDLNQVVAAQVSEVVAAETSHDFANLGTTNHGIAGQSTADLATVNGGAASTGAVSFSAGAPEALVSWAELPVVRGEELLLGTLIGNLIGNAVKFHRPGVAPRVQVSARRVEDMWEVSCVDNGIGVEPTQAENVFVIFTRLHPRDAYPGTGIGLAIAKKIVEHHGGTIWVDTSHRPGTAVRFTLPTTG